MVFYQEWNGKLTVKTGNFCRLYPVKRDGNDREPFETKRVRHFPVPVPIRPVPVPFLTTVDKKPSNAALRESNPQTLE